MKKMWRLKIIYRLQSFKLYRLCFFLKIGNRLPRLSIATYIDISYQRRNLVENNIPWPQEIPQYIILSIQVLFSKSKFISEKKKSLFSQLCNSALGILRFNSLNPTLWFHKKQLNSFSEFLFIFVKLVKNFLLDVCEWLTMNDFKR